MKNMRALLGILLLSALVLLSACGGGGSTSTTVSPSVPPLTLVTKGLPSGVIGQAYNAQLLASGGVPPYHWTGQTPAGLTLNGTGVLNGTPTAVFDGTVSVTVSDSANPAHSVSGTPSLHVAALLEVGTSSLPPVVSNTNVNISLATRGGNGPFTWAVTSGSLPAGLSLSPLGVITGNVTGATSNFTVSVVDQSIPPLTASAPLTLTVVAAAGRNDTTGTATPLSNGSFFASISPIVDPVGLPASGDLDIYKITADPGAVVTFQTVAQTLNPSSPLDTVIELTDVNGTRLQTCSVASSQGPFTDPCMDDDIDAGIQTDSRLFFSVPITAAGPVTVYLKVLDFRGDARPDMVYFIQVDGAK